MRRSTLAAEAHNNCTTARKIRAVSRSQAGRVALLSVQGVDTKVNQLHRLPMTWRSIRSRDRTGLIPADRGDVG